MNADGAGIRLTAMALVVTSLFAALFVRLWYLQILDGGHLQVVAHTNGVRVVDSPAPRGRILDRKGRPIVDNRLAEELTVDRGAFRKHPDLAGRLAGLLSSPSQKWAPSQVVSAMNDRRFSPVLAVPVAQVGPETVVTLAEHAEEFPGVQAVEVIQRHYPHGSLAAHLVGYVGSISDNEVRALAKHGYRPGDQIGKSGIELAYDTVLRGTPGTTRIEVDARGNPLGVLSRTDPVPGHDLELTIDVDIQQAAEASLAGGLEAARGTLDASHHQPFPAPAGAAVVLDPRDGAILALTSNPTYDPASFVNGISTDLFGQLQDPARGAPLLNRAVSGVYAPGSTFKLITGTAGLLRGLINPSTTIDDQGSLRIGTETLHNAGGFQYGRIDLTRALTVSSDVFFYTLGANFWSGRAQYGDAIQDTARAYGLGRPTGVDITGEQPGRLPDAETRRRDHLTNPAAFPDGGWFTGDNVNLAIGQGDLGVTPLQLANAYATFANGGTLYQPRLAAAVLDSDGTKVSSISGRVMHQMAFPPLTHDALLKGLEGAVTSSAGTAFGAFAGFPLSQYPVAGKTGTAQVASKQDTSVFTAFSPAESPRYVVTVFEEQAGFGASGSAPVARRILEAIYGLPSSPPAYLTGPHAAAAN